MRETAALPCDGGGGQGASGNGVTHHAGQRGLDGVGASETNRGRGLRAVMKQPVSVTCDGARPGTASPTMQGSEASMAWARAMDDNYGGVTTTTRTRWSRRARRDEKKDVAGTGRNSCR
jgi:hypothetical protein